MALAAQTEELVPADKKIYALRDVTATVDSIPLIAASIMSKKIAEGVQHLILDVKTGRGAFMQDPADATTLAKVMVAIGIKCGLKVEAFLTDMNQPLGFAIGNALEINESLDLLRGSGPADLKELTLCLGGQLLVMSGRVPTLRQGKEILEQKIKSGEGLQKFRELIIAQGGSPSCIDNDTYLPQAARMFSIPAQKTGYVTMIEPTRIGFTSTLLGGGRLQANDIIDHQVGVLMKVKIGDYIQQGESVMELIFNDEHKMSHALPYAQTAVTLADHPPESTPLIKELISTGVNG
jgi:pyrimidine-nucleoside phosphorylase